MSSLIAFLEEVLVWLVDLMLFVPRKIAELVLDGLASLIEVIPVPSFVSTAGGFLAAIDPTIIFVLQGFAFAEGLAVIFVAYVIRFLIRRIPVVG